jgi:mRNA interferase MazF
VKRGEVWWANLPAPSGRRPVLLLSRDQAYTVRNAVTVAFLTSTIRNIPVEVMLTPTDGVPKTCEVNLDVINTIPKHMIDTRQCVLSAAKMIEVEKALKWALDIH